MMVALLSDLRVKIVEARRNNNKIRVCEYSCIFWKPKVNIIGWEKPEKLKW